MADQIRFFHAHAKLNGKLLKRPIKNRTTRNDMQFLNSIVIVKNSLKMSSHSKWFSDFFESTCRLQRKIFKPQESTRNEIFSKYLWHEENWLFLQGMFHLERMRICWCFILGKCTRLTLMPLATHNVRAAGLSEYKTFGKNIAFNGIGPNNSHMQ